MHFDYEWQVCHVQAGPHTLTLDSAKSFQSEDRARGRPPLPFGSVLWPAALIMADVLGAEPELVRGKRVLELGCGLGLGSLVAHKLAAAEVLATDNHPDMPEMVAQNATKNGISLNYLHYNWSEPREEVRGYDVVLASDVLYEPTATTLLADAIAHCLAKKGIAIVTDPGRPHLPRFFKKLEARGLVATDRKQDLRVYDDEGLNQVLQLHPTRTRKHHVIRIRWAG